MSPARRGYLIPWGVRYAVLAVVVIAGCGRLDFGVADLPGLVARFSFETSPATTNDSLGGPSGSCNVDECPSVVPGHHGNAYRFDGVNDCILVPDAGQLDASRFSLAMWLWQASDGAMSPLSKAVPPTSNSWQIESDVGRRMSFTTNNEGNHDFLWTSDNAVAIDGWQYVVATWDGTTKRLYLDGLLAASAADSAIVLDSHGAQIGCDDNLPTIDGWYDGAIDEIELYDRALDDAEVAELARR
jgi:hypothetical protein